MSESVGTHKEASPSRRYPRHKVDMRARLVLHRDGQDTVIHGRTSHVGLGGIGMTLTQELERGTRAVLELTIPNCNVFKIPVEVRNRAGFRCGLQFLELSPEQRSLLKAFLNELPLK
jgi:hypothetical protein